MATVPDIVNTTQLQIQASISGKAPYPLASQNAGHYEKTMIMGRKTESNAFRTGCICYQPWGLTYGVFRILRCILIQHTGGISSAQSL
jgi:hypothetical protein